MRCAMNASVGGSNLLANSVAPQGVALRVALGCAVLFLFMGCSAQGVPARSPDDEIESFVARYGEALSSGDFNQRWEMICDSQQAWLNADPVRKEQLEDAVPGTFEVRAITSSDDSATVSAEHVSGRQRESIDLHLVRENGSWKLCEK